MRVRTLLAALSLAVSSAAVAPMPAFADGIEPPPVVRHAPRPHRRPAPPPVAPVIAPAPVSNTLALPAAFFTDGGGVGIDVGAGYVGGGGTTIVQGSRSTSISISSSSASARASSSSSSHSSSGGGRGHGGGGHHGGPPPHGGGDCGCGH